MSGTKLNIWEKLIEGYTKSPPPFKEQAITRVAILLCQKLQIKKYITFETEPLRRHKYSISNVEWDRLIEEASTDMCQKLPLPTALQKLVIVRILPIALNLFSWNRQQTMFKLSPIFVDRFLKPCDWTVEMRLDEKKIANRLVQDKRISVCQRFKMACFYFLESFIHSLWNQIPAEGREDLFRNDESKLVQLWSYKLAGRVEELLPSEDLFWLTLWKYGLKEASESTVFNCWNKVDISLRQEVLINTAMTTVYRIHHRIKNYFVMYLQWLPSPAPWIDILCFLLTQMSEEQKFEFFRRAFRVSHINVLACFLQWPYLDIFLPIIKKLWNILPEEKYEELLLTLAGCYSEKYYGDYGYVDYIHGGLIIELLRETPNHFKRYVFGDHHRTDESDGNGKLLDIVISKGTHEIRNINIFQHIWKHVIFEEKGSFLRSKHGESLCCYLALHDNWELLNSIVRECLPEDSIDVFQKNILESVSGKSLCFEMLMGDNGKRLNSWFNWGFSSKQEIYSYILRTYLKCHTIDCKMICDDFYFNIDLLENVIKMYSPSEEATKKFKTHFVRIHSRHICVRFVKYSKWQEIDQFLMWGFPSEDTRKCFKEWFVREYAMYLCEYHMVDFDLQDAEEFLSWCFPSDNAVNQFKQELFFFSGVKFQWNLFRKNAKDFDSLVKWFNLSPEAIYKFKKEMFLCSYSLNCIFTVLSECEKRHIKYQAYSKAKLKKIAIFLKWGLANAETVTAVKDASIIYLMNFSFSNDEVRQWVQQNWDKFINDIHSELLIERKHRTRIKGIELPNQGTIV